MTGYADEKYIKSLEDRIEALEAKLAATKLKWRTGKPSTEGRYHYRMKFGNDNWSDATICDWWRGNFYSTGGIVMSFRDDIDQCAGPIPDPEEEPCIGK